MKDRPLSAFKTLTVVFSLLFLFTSPLPPAWAVRPAVVLLQEIRANLREKGEISSEAIERLNLEFSAAGGGWRVVPFFEARNNLDQGFWSRMESGVELGIRPFYRWMPPLSWFYLGNSFHQAWVKPGNDHPEWEIRMVFDIPLSWAFRSRGLELYVLNEYTYDLDFGRGVRNEIGGGIKMPLRVCRIPALLGLGWRHVDLIHEADEDQFEGTLRVKF